MERVFGLVEQQQFISSITTSIYPKCIRRFHTRTTPVNETRCQKRIPSTPSLMWRLSSLLDRSQKIVPQAMVLTRMTAMSQMQQRRDLSTFINVVLPSSRCIPQPDVRIHVPARPTSNRSSAIPGTGDFLPTLALSPSLLLFPRTPGPGPRVIALPSSPPSLTLLFRLLKHVPTQCFHPTTPTPLSWPSVP